ncbi:unnamed protein product [Bursaphelenchus okinawaensis]|uniref:Uncharacterized protein n=1 Tax=Bursaphelenchus okinawaensis TaxID=465554 RepID=A0A811L9I3_9BILA|nr:unnamed protein product [Bursaphelenchus okinawaensis]CAG9120280.1 unnamed protein product [Bursaphelenchus okinawaensis]
MKALRERTFDLTGVLPNCLQKPHNVSKVSTEVSTPHTTSTSFITGTGLKKWRPATRSRFVFILFMTSANKKLEVFVTRIHSLKGIR